MKVFFLRALVVFAAWMSISAHADETGMRTSASVDMVGSSKVNGESDASDRLDVREAELLIYGPVDHIFDGLLSLAAHSERGVSVFEVHEAYLGSSKLIPRSRFKIGQFFLGIGRLNRVHRHEWPFITAPKVHTLFFGHEGVLDSGLEYSYLAPLPFFLDLTFGLTNGWVYGHAHNEGDKPKKPTHYVRAGTYCSVFGDGGAQTGLNYLGRTAADGEEMKLIGLDFVAKWRQDQSVLYLLQSEVWLRYRKPVGAEEEQSMGAYVYPQHALTSSVLLGTRFDYYSVLSLKDAAGKPIQNADYGIVPSITYKASEFSTLRLAYSHELSKRDAREDRKNQKIEVQATLMMGAHPAHDF